MTLDEQALLDKLRRVEALFSGAATAGERDAAEAARERIQGRLAALEAQAPPVEYRFRLDDPWARRLFVALLRRYGLRPYRYPRQRQASVMVRVSKRFVDEILWPEFQELSKTLRQYLSEVTERVVSQALHEDAADAEVVPEPPAQLAGETHSGRVPTS